MVCEGLAHGWVYFIYKGECEEICWVQDYEENNMFKQTVSESASSSAETKPCQAPLLLKVVFGNTRKVSKQGRLQRASSRDGSARNASERPSTGKYPHYKTAPVIGASNKQRSRSAPAGMMSQLSSPAGSQRMRNRSAPTASQNVHIKAAFVKVNMLKVGNSFGLHPLLGIAVPADVKLISKGSNQDGVYGFK